jgi:hypothetical protein
MSEPKKIERISQLALWHLTKDYLTAIQTRAAAYRTYSNAKDALAQAEAAVVLHKTCLGEQTSLRPNQRLVVNLDDIKLESGKCGKGQVMIVDMNPGSMCSVRKPEDAIINIERVEGEMS